MKMPPQKLPGDLAIDLNRRVLAHVAEKSAHSDLGDLLLDAVKPLGDVQLYSPDWPTYRYVVASTKHVIFGFGVEMNTLAFRLDETFKDRALATGGIEFSECGDDWVRFIPFRDDWPRIDFEFWALKAYAYAREIGE